MDSLFELMKEQTKSFTRVQQQGNLYGQHSALVGLRVIINEQIKEVEKKLEEHNESLLK